MTVPNSTQATPTIAGPEKLPALPPKRARRRSTRASHAWRFRKPPSRKRVELAAARALPQEILVPQIAPRPAQQ